MIADQVIREELEWTINRFKKSKERLDDGGVVDSQIPLTYGSLGRKCLFTGNCYLLLDENDPQSWYRKAAEYITTKGDKLDEYQDVVSSSAFWHQPKDCFEALTTSILADDAELAEKAVIQTYGMDREWLLSEHPEFAHVVYYDLALASFLDDDEAGARKWLSELEALDHDSLKYGGSKWALEGVLEGGETTLKQGVEMLLQHHHDDFGSRDPVAAGFVSSEALAHLVLARRHGIEIDLEEIDEELRQYLPPELPEWL